MNQSSVVVKCVEIRVLPGATEAFIQATLDNARATRKEPGNLRFEINQSSADPELFFLFEAFANHEAVEFHKAQAHYQRWCSVAEPLMAEKRKTTDCRIIFSDALGV